MGLLLSFLIIALGAAPAFGQPLAQPGRAADCAHFFRSLGEAVEVEERAEGPRLSPAALPGARPLEEFHELRLGAYNVLNLQSSVGKYEHQADGSFLRVRDPRAKPEAARKALAQEILGKDPDFLFMQEVEGFAPLAEFNQQYLNRAYRPILIQGNDSRGIDVAMLVKQDFPLDVEVLSHANVKHLNPRTGERELLHSRDAPLVLLRRPGAPETERPFLALLGAHLKSQRDAAGDPGSVLKRTEQLQGVIEILQRLERRFPGLPAIVAGDFNTDVRVAPELKPLWDAGMKDSFTLGPHPIPEKFRITHTFHPQPDPQGAELPAVKMQLDSMILNRAGAELGLVNDARIVLHRNENGVARTVPETFAERQQNPSDHFMIFGQFNFAKLRALWESHKPLAPPPR